LRDVAHLSPLQQILLLQLLRLRDVDEIIIHIIIIIIIIHGLLRRRRRVPAARSSATASLPARLFRLLDDGVKVTIESQRVSLIHVLQMPR
jgi:hypothetical protein